MNPVDNPYNPGAGTPPPELAGREGVLKQAETTIERTKNGKAAKSVIMLGLRGVGKTVLLAGVGVSCMGNCAVLSDHI